MTGNSLEELGQALAANPALWVVAALLTLCMLVGTAVMTARRRRLRDVAAVLGESTAGVLQLNAGARRGRLSGAIVPAPVPFAQLLVEFTMRARDLPLGAQAGRRGLPLIPPQRLVLRGFLGGTAVNELVWVRGRAPDRALGRGSGTHLWVTHRLEILQSEYAVRGPYSSTLEKTFVDMQTRYGAFTQAVTVQPAKPQLIVVLSAQGLNAEELPHLIALVRALGRAALRS